MSISPTFPPLQTAAVSRSLVPTARSVVLAIANGEQRLRLREALVQLRWQVYDLASGAAAMARLEDLRPEALLVADWLPDLDVREFAAYACMLVPEMDVLRMDGTVFNPLARSPRRHELLEVLRKEADAVDGAPARESAARLLSAALPRLTDAQGLPASPGLAETCVDNAAASGLAGYLPEMVGTSAVMAELGKLVRLVAPRSTTVLIEGETGTGKELVAKALHRLSTRVNKPFLVLNCAAIPEALLEAELFGHTRGAFTGAVRSRTGRIEAADGGTLFLDEIGEMPLALQAKMLRFMECGELQRVGDNEVTYVDVRVIAATHQPLEQRAEEQSFRLDLYHRLAVFPVEVPNLRSRMDDLPLLAQHFLDVLSRGAGPSKTLSLEALERLKQHNWPGNVRELMHVMERGLILAGTNAVIGPEDIRVRKRDRSA